MGNIRKFDLRAIIKGYKVKHFVETGTFRGDGVAFAVNFPFRTIWSVEIIPELAEECSKRFEENPRVTIVCGESVSALSAYLPTLRGPAIFWLDAHFPGADAGLSSYESGNENLRLPLSLELQAIAKARNCANDVFIIDDLRIYEEGDFENGEVPRDAVPSGARSIAFVESLFEKTHKIIRSYRDEGYLIVLPRKRYFWKHLSIRQLFNKQVVEDPYML